jgi:uncharacterized protein (TIGR01655 family)
MFQMKKFMVPGVLVVLILVAFGWYKVNYSGEKYYTLITEPGVRVNVHQGGNSWYYNYSVEAVNDKGETKQLDFQTVEGARPISRNRFVQLIWNKKKGVLSFEGVNKEEVHKSVVAKLMKP